MTIDPLLLAVLRDKGMPDVRIRHLHDTVERGGSLMRDAAIHLMSDLAGGPVRHYTREDGLTAELAIDDGIHWTGRALRVSATRAIPATVLAMMPGRTLSAIVEFPGSDGHVVTGVSTDTTGATWLAATALKVQPPARGGAWRRLAMTVDLRRDHERRRRSMLVTAGDWNTAAAAAMFLMMALGVAWFVSSRSPSGALVLGAASTVMAVILYLQPRTRNLRDPRRDHMVSMKALQTSQGW